MVTSTAITLRLTTPANQALYTLSDAPAMPALRVDAVLTPALPAVNTLRFEWKVRVVFGAGDTPHGVAGTPWEFGKITTGGTLNLSPADWPRIRGGQVTVSASVVALGKTLTASLTGLRIAGKNPNESAIRLCLASDPLQRIARQESGMRQFGADGWPLFSADNLGGAGLGQITPSSEDQRWNWRTNADAMRAKFKQTSTLAGVYQQSVRDSAAFKALVTALNQARAKLKQTALVVGVPEWSPEQVTRDAIRGYNGWAGSDPVVPGLHLHEYRLGVDAQGLLIVTIQGNGPQAQAVWKPVLPSERPASGDPYYVDHVLAQPP